MLFIKNSSDSLRGSSHFWELWYVERGHKPILLYVNEKYQKIKRHYHYYTDSGLDSPARLFNDFGVDYYRTYKSNLRYVDVHNIKPFLF